MDRGAWRATVQRVTESRTQAKRWSTQAQDQGGEHRGSRQQMRGAEECEASLHACPSHLLSVPDPSADCYHTASIHGDTAKETSFAMIIISFILRFMPMNYSQHKKGSIYMASKIFMLYKPVMLCNTAGQKTEVGEEWLWGGLI